MASERENPSRRVAPAVQRLGAEWKEPLCRAGMLGATLGMFLFFAVAFFVIELPASAPGLRGRLGALLAPSGRFPTSALLMFYAGLAPFFVACNLLKLAGCRRLRKRLRNAGGLLCPGCHYNLSTLDANARCPECGREAAAGDARAYWASCGLWDKDQTRP